MALEFCFPDVGEGITEGEVVRWLVQEGETVRTDQPMVEVETDKAIVEIPAPQTGTILHLAVDEGEKIHVGNVLVVIGEAGETIAHQSPAVAASVDSSSVSVVGTLSGKLTDLPPAPEAMQLEDMPAKPSRILAIPSVRKLARELGVDLASVTPTGPRGRIRREDVLHASTQQTPPDTRPDKQTLAGSQMQEDDGPTERLPLPALRRTIAEAMVRAASTAVPITTTDEVDVTDLVAMRQRGKETAASQGVHVTLLPFIMKAVVAALRQHPYLNATFADDQRHLILKRYYHLGIATDTPDGLIVPVIKHVDQKSILTLATELQEQAELARKRRIPLSDLRGSTFTISNYGAIGGIFATPMLNLPEVAILGVGKLLQKPIALQGEVVIRHVLPLSLTFDHRPLDGATAQRFLNDLMAYLADPARLLLVL